MNQHEAITAIATLQAAFPSMRLPDSTVTMWSTLLAEPEHHFELVDAQAAAGMLAMQTTRLPSLREFTDAITAARYSRLAKVAGLPEPVGEVVSLADFVKANPEYRDRLRKMGGLIGDALKAEADA